MKTKDGRFICDYCKKDFSITAVRKNQKYCRQECVQKSMQLTHKIPRNTKLKIESVEYLLYQVLPELLN